MCDTSGVVTLSRHFQMGQYTLGSVINIAGKTVTIYGQNATLDASQIGQFFVVDGGDHTLIKGAEDRHTGMDGIASRTVLELHDLTLRNGSSDTAGGAIAVGNGAAVG